MDTWQSINKDEKKTDEGIIQSILQDPVSKVLTEPAEEDNEIVYQTLPTATEATEGLETALRFLKPSECITAAKITHLSNLLHDAKSDSQKISTQRKVTDFFSKK